MPVNLNRPDGLLNGCFTPGPKPAILRAAPVSGYVAGTRGGRLGRSATMPVSVRVRAGYLAHSAYGVG